MECYLLLINLYANCRGHKFRVKRGIPTYLILLPTIMSFINSLGTLFQLTAENDYLFLEMRRSTVSQAAFRGLKSKSAENSREYFHGTGRSFYHINM